MKKRLKVKKDWESSYKQLHNNNNPNFSAKLSAKFSATTNLVIIA